MSKLGCNRRSNEHNGRLVKSFEKNVERVCRRRNTAARVETNSWCLPGSLSFTARQANKKFGAIGNASTCRTTTSFSFNGNLIGRRGGSASRRTIRSPDLFLHRHLHFD